MKKQLIITSLLTLSACVSTSGKIQNMIPTEIDGLKVYTNSEVKKCGIKDKDGDFMQRCDKKTDSFLNGIVYFRNDEKDEIREYIDYYKDGHKIKYITKKNGVVTQETNYTLDIKNNLLNFTGKDYFDNGALFCERSGSREYTAWEDITANRT
ncbi:MAG: hypothetical protein IJ638_02185, partial [Alphaproteobacteria bacterium]|nr:hypothetical protein [Alphaproteobacteria bacterium]